MSSYCSFECAVKQARKLQEAKHKRQQAEFKRETKRRKDKLKSRAEWLKDAQAVFNKFIRLRDEKDACISCGRHHQGQYHAGHYLTVGACPELRFNELNVHKQCAPCNNHLSGNLVNYRIRLIDKIGLDKVEWLEGQHDPLKITIPEIKDLIAEYKAKIKAITGQSSE
jgi:hypothetical protein